MFSHSLTECRAAPQDPDRPEEGRRADVPWRRIVPAALQLGEGGGVAWLAVGYGLGTFPGVAEPCERAPLIETGALPAVRSLPHTFLYLHHGFLGQAPLHRRP